MADPQDTPSSGFSSGKKVDESWKDSIEKEKGGAEPEPGETSQEPTFASFLSMLGMQAFFSMGDFQDPASPEIKVDLAQAKYLIDIIEILSNKTKGNLSQEEETMVRELLYGLKMKFVEKSYKT